MKKKAKEILEESEVTRIFNKLKEQSHEVTAEELQQSRENLKKIRHNAQLINQERLFKKADFLLSTIDKELKLYDLGITRYIDRFDLEKVVIQLNESIAGNENKRVYISELKNFPRIIPQEAIDKILLVQDIFDELHIIFTDYTPETEARSNELKMRDLESGNISTADKDPIVFGVFIDKSNTRDAIVNNRFYLIADWIDEVCDITIEKIASMDLDIIKDVDIEDDMNGLKRRIEDINNN